MGKSYKSAIEAVLFACGEPIELSRLAEGLEIEKAALREQLCEYQAELESDDRGFELIFLDDKVQLCSKPQYESLIVTVASLKKQELEKS